jgi:hypothetical protein
MLIGASAPGRCVAALAGARFADGSELLAGIGSCHVGVHAMMSGFGFDRYSRGLLALSLSPGRMR